VTPAREVHVTPGKAHVTPRREVHVTPGKAHVMPRKARDIQLFMVRLATPQLEGTESDALEAEMIRLYPETFEPPTGVPKRRPYDLQIRLREGAKPFHTTPVTGRIDTGRAVRNREYQLR
jgi:hypothetical protein